MTARPIDVVLGECAADWLAIPGVVGVGVGEHAGEPCIRVFVETASEAFAQRLPSGATCRSPLCAAAGLQKHRSPRQWSGLGRWASRWTADMLRFAARERAVATGDPVLQPGTYDALIPGARRTITE